MLSTRRINNNGPSQKGFTLIELMIGLLIGLIVMAAAGMIYLMSVRGSTYAVRSAKLNQEVRTGMLLMGDDIRRAGLWGNFSPGNENPFTARTGAPITDIYILPFNGVNRACILYSYDATYQANNIVGTPDQVGSIHPGTDFFGFRLGTNRALQMRHGGNTTNDCSNGLWESITDPETVIIDALSFDTGGSQCVNLTTSVSWEVPANAVTPACATTIAAGYVAPASGNQLLELRRINIRIQAHHQNDDQLRIDISESIKVRNDRVFTQP